MRKYSGFILAVGLLATTPALAGTLTFEGGQTVWHSTQCPKPTPPQALTAAHPETSGEDMNTLMSEHNAYIEAAQFYMNCVSNEAATDQTAVNEQIKASAEKDISDMQASVDQSAKVVRERQ